MIPREERRKPASGPGEQVFLSCRSQPGIKTGHHNLPDREETPEGFKRCLDSLCQITPPTALIFDEKFSLCIVQQHLARCGILAPEHDSLVGCDPDSTIL